MSTVLFNLRQKREKAIAKADAILLSVETAKRTITAEESKTVDDCMAEVNALNPQIKKLDNNNTLAARYNENPALFLGGGTHDGNPSRETASGVWADVDRWLFKGGDVPEGCEAMSASLAEGSGLGIVIPPYEILNWRSATPYILSFEEAGCSTYPLANFSSHEIRVPFYLPGTKAQTFAEETGPTSTQDCNVVGLKVTASKYVVLSKVSEESFWDTQIDGVVSAEGQKRLGMSYTQDVTNALVTSLEAAGMALNRGSDYLADILDLQAAISTAFLGPNNCFMMSRAGLALVRNTRSSIGTPLFDPSTRTFLGAPVVLNDFLGKNILFGNFQEGVHLSKTGIYIQRLFEQYREQGKIGYRMLTRVGSAFYSDAYKSTDIQPIAMLRLDATIGGS